MSVLGGYGIAGVLVGYGYDLGRGADYEGVVGMPCLNAEKCTQHNNNNDASYIELYEDRDFAVLKSRGSFEASSPSRGPIDAISTGRGREFETNYSTTPTSVTMKAWWAADDSFV